MMLVKATREGLPGKKTASGYVIDTVVPFVALPSHNALGRFVQLSNPLNGKMTQAVVLDVGPWNTHDEYWIDGRRPQAESGESISNEGTNGAGIDLSDRVWNELGMKDNTNVWWEFIDGKDN